MVEREIYCLSSTPLLDVDLESWSTQQLWTFWHILEDWNDNVRLGERSLDNIKHYYSIQQVKASLRG